eukprot:CAMPEP_0197592096 /NCGR_PEP_ID=MMETSP1326-20131121/14633_1 /TAXON_ID=1155430 /ORGANISM="Genus nov. species nov., Strain RCC2288" /LENGTH=59 /DNA_ID=CAMNT_0043157733 /DNA_START=95 /DNA_END=269 /DNA_ORIENTATION=+
MGLVQEIVKSFSGRGTGEVQGAAGDVLAGSAALLQLHPPLATAGTAAPLATAGTAAGRA